MDQGPVHSLGYSILQSPCWRHRLHVFVLREQSAKQRGACAGLEVSTYPFREGFSENVIAELRGAEDPSKIVIVSGHYDSRSTNISVGLTGLGLQHIVGSSDRFLFTPH